MRMLHISSFPIKRVAYLTPCVWYSLCLPVAYSLPCAPIFGAGSGVPARPCQTYACYWLLKFKDVVMLRALVPLVSNLAQANQTKHSSLQLGYVYLRMKTRATRLFFLVREATYLSDTFAFGSSAHVPAPETPGQISHRAGCTAERPTSTHHVPLKVPVLCAWITDNPSPAGRMKLWSSTVGAQAWRSMTSSLRSQD